MPDIVGVLRESEFSPGRVADDAAILERTATALAERGVRLALGNIETLDGATPAAVLAMCQSDASLTVLDRYAAAIPVINSPTAIRNCHRIKTVKLLGDGTALFPRTRIVDTAHPVTPSPDDTPCWVKRGDVHAMERDDVAFATDADSLTTTLRDFAARGITRAVLQDHQPGSVLKFYGVGNRFFRCYTDGPEPPATVETLWNTARAGASRLGLQVYGGDVVVTPDGRSVLIDVNDWPSFARCRNEAADAIADYVCNRIGVAVDKPHAIERH